MAAAKYEVDLTELTKHIGLVSEVIDKERLLTGIGWAHFEWINENFETEGGKVGGWLPLSKGTLAARAERGNKDARILQDSGAMRQSLDFEVKGDAVRIFIAKEYASYHNDGTGPYTIEPKGNYPLKFKGADGSIVYARRVNHPGIPQRRMIPNLDESVEIVKDLVRVKIAEIERGFDSED